MTELTSQSSISEPGDEKWAQGFVICVHKKLASVQQWSEQTEELLLMETRESISVQWAPRHVHTPCSASQGAVSCHFVLIYNDHARYCTLGVTQHHFYTTWPCWTLVWSDILHVMRLFWFYGYLVNSYIPLTADCKSTGACCYSAMSFYNLYSCTLGLLLDVAVQMLSRGVCACCGLTDCTHLWKRLSGCSDWPAGSEGAEPNHCNHQAAPSHATNDTPSYAAASLKPA